MITAFVSIGSNIEPRLANCLGVIEHISKNKKITIEVVSSWYESNPVPPAQKTDPKFINGIVQIKTSLTAFELLVVCKEIERKLGRENAISGMPRTADLDIIIFGDEIINSSELTIPHPKIAQRLFVLIPFCDINPSIIHPILKKTFIEILNEKIRLGGADENIHRYSGY